MQAQAAWLSAHKAENPDGVLEAADLQDEYMQAGSQGSRARPAPDNKSTRQKASVPNLQ